MIKILVKALVAGLILLALTACGERVDLAPVEDLNGQTFNLRNGQYRVQRGDTLFAIAFRYDRDYRQLAALNHLSYPYHLREGQILRIQPGRIVTRPVSRRYSPPTHVNPPSRRMTTYSRPVFGRSNGWVWPARGHIVSNFLPGQGKKGLDIAGRKGAKIYAAKDGVVAYAGSGLAGYGNLIIIKHDNQFLTAYGNNARNLVTEGQSIRAGQVIADMGIVNRRYWGVHFEIRRSGNPVNPLNYLK